MALLAVVFFFLLASSTTFINAELTVPVNKTRSSLTFQDPSTSTTLDIFFKIIVAQSNSANFYRISVSFDTPTSVDGHYQCSANLSHTDCQTCVKKLTSIIPRQCKTATAERVDCNMDYEVNPSQDIDSGSDLGLMSDGGEDYGGSIGAFVAFVVAIAVSMLLLQS